MPPKTPPRRFSKSSLGSSIHARIHAQFIAPLRTHKGSNEYIARSVAVGLVAGLSPLLGLQVVLIGIVWWICNRWAAKWRFSWVIAFAWSWVSNPISIVPMYYFYITTGRILMGQAFGAERSVTTLSGYEALQRQLALPANLDSDFFAQIFYYLNGLLHNFGLPLFIGSLPWMVIGSWLGYQLTLRSLVAFRQHRRNQASAPAKDTND